MRKKKSIRVTQRKAPTYEVKWHSNPDNHQPWKVPAHTTGEEMPPNEIEKNTQKQTGSEKEPEEMEGEWKGGTMPW